MSIFDDIALPIGTEYYNKKIVGWDVENQKYLIEYPAYTERPPEQKWMPRKVVERHHASFVMQGVETRESKPGNGYNTRYYRSKTD
jgi:hypothetical protein